MPTHIPTELKLDVPICEEDIGDLSPYSVPLSGFRTTNSSYSINSSLSRHEVASAAPYSGNDIHRMLVLETPMRGIFDVSRLVIYRSQFHLLTPWMRHSDISPSCPSRLTIQATSETPGRDQLTHYGSHSRCENAEMGSCVRCRCVFPFPSCFRLTQNLVEFDIDTGPTVDALYPPLKLRPAEMETLYIHIRFGPRTF